MKWNGNNTKYYIAKGYKYTKQGEEFDLIVEDLNPSSKKEIYVACDSCGKERYLSYSVYLRYLKNGKYLCNKCGNKHYYNNKKIKKSFYDWCIENKKDYYIYWDYDKNNKTPQEVSFGSQNKFYFKCRHGIHESELKQINRMRFEHSYAVKCDKCNSIAQYGIDMYGNNFLQDYWSDKNVEDPWKMSYGARNIIYIKCVNGHEDYETTANRITSYGVCCPKCISMSMGEQRIEKYLRLNNIPYIPQKRFDDLVGIGGRNLSYDFYLPNHSMCIEAQGGQHGSPVDFFGGQEQFEKQQEHDRRKKQYAIDHGIEFLEIWYYDFNNIETILNNKLKGEQTHEIN